MVNDMLYWLLVNVWHNKLLLVIYTHCIAGEWHTDCWWMFDIYIAVDSLHTLHNISPDVILCGWLGSKQQLTNTLHCWWMTCTNCRWMFDINVAVDSLHTLHCWWMTYWLLMNVDICIAVGSLHVLHCWWMVYISRNYVECMPSDAAMLKARKHFGTFD